MFAIPIFVFNGTAPPVIYPVSHTLPLPYALASSSLRRMHKTFGGLLTARADMLRVHRSLKHDAREYAGSPEQECPDNNTVFTGAEYVEEPAERKSTRLNSSP